jgi:hypothetical protein
MTLKEAIEQLKAAGARLVEAEYDGSGDEGCVETVTAFGSENKEVSITKDVEAAVSEAAEAYLEKHGINWYDGSGGFGKYTLWPSTGKQKLEHNTRVDDTEYDEFEDDQETEEEGAKDSDTPQARVCTCPDLLSGHHKGCPYKEA